MGAKTWTLTYSNGNSREILESNPELDRDATNALVRTLFPTETIELLEDGELSSTYPEDNEILVGCFPGLSIISATEFGIDFPSKLHSKFLEKATGHTVHLHAMHSVADWFAFAVWKNGTIQRSLSISPEFGIMEDIGPRLLFEEPYWLGQHPVFDPEDEGFDYPFVFHPLELAEAALREFFGYQLEGSYDPNRLKPEQIPLIRYKR